MHYAVNKVSLMSQHLQSQWSALKRTIRYLKGTPNSGLVFQPASVHFPVCSQAYCNADWPSDLDDGRSTSGGSILFGPNLISWSSKK